MIWILNINCNKFCKRIKCAPQNFDLTIIEPLVTTTNASSTLPIALTLITAAQMASSSELEEVLVTASRQSASAFELPYTLNTLNYDQLAQQ